MTMVTYLGGGRARAQKKKKRDIMPYDATIWCGGIVMMSHGDL